MEKHEERLMSMYNEVQDYTKQLEEVLREDCKNFADYKDWLLIHRENDEEYDNFKELYEKFRKLISDNRPIGGIGTRMTELDIYLYRLIGLHPEYNPKENES